MLSESLSCEQLQVDSLVTLLEEKTAGNPFFVIQFLLMLYEEKLLYLNFKVRKWQWNIEEIRGQGFTDNVVDLMVKKVQKLPAPTQNLLRLAACIGAKFNLKTLSIISERSLIDVARDLWPAVNEGLLQTVDENHKLILNMEALENDSDNYPEAVDRFLHDRVQQAAYLLIDEDEQQEVHLNIGRELLSDVSNQDLEENIFKIVPHLNKGVDLIESKKERIYLADLNLQAALKAKNSSAWKPALHYLKIGISLLPHTIWQENEHLAYKLYRENIDCHFCDGRSEEGDYLYRELMAKPITESEKIELCNIAVLNYSSNPEHMEDAINIGLKSLSLLGMYLDKHPSEETIGKSIEKATQLVSDRSIDSLFDLPQMTDERAKQLVDTIAVLGPSTYISGSPLLITSNMEMLLTIVEFGNCSLSSYCYAYQGVINTILGNYSVAFEYAKLALKVFNADPNPAISGRVHMMYNNFGGQWGDSLQNTTAVRTKGFQKAMEIGDLHWGIYNYLYGFPCEVITAESSHELLGRYSKIVKLGSKLHPLDYMAVSMQRNVLLNLRGEIEDRNCISSELNEVEEITKGYGMNITLLLSMHACQALVYFLNGDFESIVKISLSEQCSAWKKPNQGLYSTIFFMFLESLAIMRDKTVYDKETRIELDNRVDETIKQSEVWAKTVPQTYDCMRLMLLAEKNSRDGIHKNTLSYYEQAIQLSRDNRFILFEGIAGELCSDYWQRRGNAKIADLFLTKAMTAFDLWGAKRKVEELKQQSKMQFGSLPQLALVERNRPDLDVVISVLQKISRATVLDELIQASLTSCIKHCSLFRALFLLHIDGELIVKAELQSESLQIDLIHKPMILDKSLPINLINEVVESRQANHPTSGQLCLPILQQNKVLGLIYMESSQTSFSPATLALLDIIISQTAISLENSLLYSERVTSEAELRKRRLLLQSIIDNAKSEISLKDPHSAYLLINKQFEKAYNINETSVLGQCDETLFDAELVESFSHDSVVESEQEITVDGNKRFLLSSTIPLVDGQHKALGTCRIATDITSQKTAAEEKIELERQLLATKKIESIGQLASGIAHDFNSILTGIYCFGTISQEHLKRECLNKEKLIKSIKSIQSTAEKGSALTNQLLAFNQKKRQDANVVDLKEIMFSMNSILTKLLGEECKLELNFSGGPFYMKSDVSHMEQIILNLVVNARDAMAKGGKVELHLKTITKEDELFNNRPELKPQPLIELRATDEGCGMSKKLIEKIFDPFFTTKEEGKGTGLGLATTVNVVKKNGGHIFVNSKEGEGTTFYVYFPQSADAPEKHIEIAVSDLPGGKESILLVEGDENLRHVTAKLLERLGYKIYQSSNGEEALALLSSLDESVDILFSNLIMSGMDGISLADKITGRAPETKVILITGNSDQLPDVSYQVLNKPIKIETLAQVFYELKKDSEK